MKRRLILLLTCLLCACTPEEVIPPSLRPDHEKPEQPTPNPPTPDPPKSEPSGTDPLHDKAIPSYFRIPAVHITTEGGVAIDDCVALSRHIESKLDRDKEDFSLMVGSAGI